MAEKYLMLDLNDPKSEKLSEVLANKTCKRILNLLSEEELSESEIASHLNLPLNTAEYNIKKLVNVGLAEESKRFFCSVKGKKIKSYKLANKKILISPRSSFKGIISSIVVSGLAALGIWYYYTRNSFVNLLSSSNGIVEKTSDLIVSAPEAVSCGVDEIASCTGILQQAWIWFLIGALFGLLVFLLFNKLKGGFFKK